MAEESRVTHRLPLSVSIESRDGVQALTGTSNYALDARAINVYHETGLEGQTRMVKRPGINPVVAPGTPAAAGGIFMWNEVLYCIVGTNFAKWDGTTYTSIGTVDGTNGTYTFVNTQAAVNKLFFHNGVKAYVYDPSNGLVAITDTNFVSLALAQGCAFLDGTTYVLDRFGKIWGSALGDPTTWPALNFIQAQIDSSESPIRIIRKDSYILVFKRGSTEVFYDAGNPTGSPLSTVPGAKLDFGAAVGHAMLQIGDKILFVGGSNYTTRAVYYIDASLQPTKVSTPYIEACLNRFLVQGAVAITAAWQCQSRGHVFYVIALSTNSPCYAYDLTEGKWSIWTGTGSTNVYVPIAASSQAFSSGGIGFADDNGMITYVQHATTGELMKVSTDNYTDQMAIGGTVYPIVCDIYTNSFDGGLRKRKTLVRLEMICDQYQGSTLSVRFSDNDYKSWSNFRTINLGNKRAFLSNLGTFVKRAFHFRHTAPVPLRLEAAELELLLGSY